MLQKKSINRRQFLGGAAAGAAGLTIVPRHVLGGAGYTAPSEKLNIAAIGVGNRGAVDLQNVSTENIVALCDVDEDYAAPVFELYPKAKKYRDFRKMLEKEKNIDAVMVAVPDHSHAVVAMTAIKMGKHVYCEKPLTRTVYEARKLTEAAREAKVATQWGNQGHASEGIRLINEWIRDGAIGPVREVHAWTNRPMWPQGVGRPKDTPPVPSTLDWDIWLGPAPQRAYHPAYLPRFWRGWWDFGTGALGDMAGHLMDSPYWALKLGYPTSVEACSSLYSRKVEGKKWGEIVINRETYPRASIVRYEFPARDDMPPATLTWYDGGLRPARPKELEEGRSLANQGVIFVGDKGKLMSDRDGGSPRLIPESKMKAYKLPPKTIPRSIGHWKEWIEACKGGKPAMVNFDYAGPLNEVILLGNIALQIGEKLYWDGPNMKVTNVPEANEYIHRQYRQGWSL